MSENLSLSRSEKIIKLKKQYKVLGCYIEKTPIDLYPIKNLKLQMLSSVDSGYCIFLADSYKIFPGNNDSPGACICSTIDSYDVGKIIFENNDINYLKQNIDQILCCKILSNNNNRLRGINLINIEEYILNLKSVHVMIEDINAMIHIRKSIELSGGKTSLILHFKDEYLEVGKFTFHPNFLDCFRGMKWTVDV